MGGMIPSMPQTPFWHLTPTDGQQKKPFQQEIFLLETDVAGLFFAENLQDVEVFLVPGFRLELLREPQNEYDERAIQIFVSPKDRPKQRIGYIPRAQNEILSRLMDAGKYLYAVIQEKRTHPDGQFDLTIRVFMED